MDETEGAELSVGDIFAARNERIVGHGLQELDSEGGELLALFQVGRGVELDEKKSVER
jgi:hypothetical protein